MLTRQITHQGQSGFLQGRRQQTVSWRNGVGSREQRTGIRPSQLNESTNEIPADVLIVGELGSFSRSGNV
jgi:hypothetical protein